MFFRKTIASIAFTLMLRPFAASGLAIKLTITLQRENGIYWRLPETEWRSECAG